MKSLMPERDEVVNEVVSRCLIRSKSPCSESSHLLAWYLLPKGRDYDVNGWKGVSVYRCLGSTMDPTGEDGVTCTLASHWQPADPTRSPVALYMYIIQHAHTACVSGTVLCTSFVAQRHSPHHHRIPTSVPVAVPCTSPPSSRDRPANCPLDPFTSAT